MGDEELLLVPTAKRLMFGTAFFAVFFGFELALALTGVLDGWWRVSAPAVFLVALALTATAAWRAARAPWQVRCSAAGVEVRGFEPVAWSALAEIRIGPYRPRWVGFLSAFPSPRGLARVIAFVPGEEGGVPAVSVYDPYARPGRQLSARNAHLARKRYGSPLLVFTHSIDVSPADIAEVLRKLTGVRVIET
ncbi:hypothetical protein QRX50_44790 [Amycolatopsis carbonis]|uniref:Uncharacterized protein n=1 Tax=Amycolatopsis carbonis TaxID=715471 RepID=A0A9Y2MWW0_9PSEU|nr:hypothetical protein [Amycolatopsis sp. 2-15]WIX78399.1 hypothetical protein QRX50_44790 [Amycolatopsis sp. 2-15]